MNQIKQLIINNVNKILKVKREFKVTIEGVQSE